MSYSYRGKKFYWVIEALISFLSKLTKIKLSILNNMHIHFPQVVEVWSQNKNSIVCVLNKALFTFSSPFFSISKALYITFQKSVKIYLFLRHFICFEFFSKSWVNKCSITQGFSQTEDQDPRKSHRATKIKKLYWKITLKYNIAWIYVFHSWTERQNFWQVKFFQNPFFPLPSK